MAHFNLDDIYVAVSEEALFAADIVAQGLNVGTNSPVYEGIAIQCGRALKQFFEIDHEMGLQARQKIVRGMIERAQASGVYFDKISDNFMSMIENQDPELFVILNSALGPDTKDLSRMFFHNPKMDPMSLCGSWIDPLFSVTHLHNLETAAKSLMYIRQCSFVDQLRDIYKIHTPGTKTNPHNQKKEVYETLARKKPEDAALFKFAMEELEKSHPNVASDLLQRFYFFDFDGYGPSELNSHFSYSIVLSAEQSQTIARATEQLNEYWANISIVDTFCDLWIHDAITRAHNIMEGIGQQHDLLLEVEPNTLDKDKIEQRRANVAHQVRQNLNF